MNKLMLMTAIAVGTLAITGCKAKKADAPVVEKTETMTESTSTSTSSEAMTEKVTGYTKADYMKACEQSMTETQCNCYVDFYKSVGLKVTDLGDSAKVTAAMSDLKPEQTMEMAKCMQ